MSYFENGAGVTGPFVGEEEEKADERRLPAWHRLAVRPGEEEKTRVGCLVSFCFIGAQRREI